MDMLKSRLIICFMLLFISGKSMAIEEAKYDVLIKENNIEVRQYEPYIVAQTLVNDTFEDAGNKAFSRLFNYISGDNKSKQEIAMTAPVSQTGQKIEMTAPVAQQKSENGWIISFMMPMSFTLETIPKPNNPDVHIRKNESQLMASIEYSGFWSESNYLENKSKLETWISNSKYKSSGNPIWARYNAPFTPWFLRRNEVLIPIEKTTEKSIN